MVVGKGGPGEGGLGVGADCAEPGGLGITTEGFFCSKRTISQLDFIRLKTQGSPRRFHQIISSARIDR